MGGGGARGLGESGLGVAQGPCPVVTPLTPSWSLCFILCPFREYSDPQPENSFQGGRKMLLCLCSKPRREFAGDPERKSKALHICCSPHGHDIILSCPSSNVNGGVGPECSPLRCLQPLVSLLPSRPPSPQTS